MVDRKFAIGQKVVRGGLRGKITDVIPLVTVKLHDSGETDKKKDGPINVIPDLCLSDIQPISVIG